eukprot:Clim_evm3s244 gene=Clim_evmTU3s244
MKFLFEIIFAFLVAVFYVDATPMESGKDSSPASSTCPFGAAGQGRRNSDWWPNRINVDVLRYHSQKSNPLGEDFNYVEQFKKLKLEDVKKDLRDLMTDSQSWWPADFGHYGPFFVRMAWHSAGTYRADDGRGGSGHGMQRFAPLNSWPDNVNLDKARRLLWPIKQKYGSSISWGDLIILCGTVALEDMGLETVGFGGGRLDLWQPEEDTYWGTEPEFLTGDERFTGKRKLDSPLAATEMGLIYVNPEGPRGQPVPKKAAFDIRATFGRMGMNDEEIVALIGGGHTFGKAHGAAKPDYKGPEPAAAPIQNQDFGWLSSFGTGFGDDTISSGLEVTWTNKPTEWNNGFFHNLFEYEWELTTSPAGAWQWKAAGDKCTVPDAAHPDDPSKRHTCHMMTTDLALRDDPGFKEISLKFYKDPEYFAKAFAQAWFKLTHRDMGPKSRYLGPDVPKEDFIWQDPLPAVDHKLVKKNDVKKLKEDILSSGLSTSQLVSTAWASASTFRVSDMRGGANGARIRLSPMKDWEVNNPKELKEVLKKLEEIQKNFNNSNKNKVKISIADVIVLAGTTAVEAAAEAAGVKIELPFTPGRTDATQDMTDVESFEVLNPTGDGFRSYKNQSCFLEAEELLLDKAQLLTLTPPEMTVLVGGMRAMGANYDGSKLGVLTDKPGVLTNDFFVNLLDISTVWEPADEFEYEFIGRDRETLDEKYRATRYDLIFGHHDELRALSEVYGSNDAKERFVREFGNAWVKVMDLDRYDVAHGGAAYLF